MHLVHSHVWSAPCITPFPNAYCTWFHYQQTLLFKCKSSLYLTLDIRYPCERRVGIRRKQAILKKTSWSTSECLCVFTQILHPLYFCAVLCFEPFKADVEPSVIYPELQSKQVSPNVMHVCFSRCIIVALNDNVSMFWKIAISCEQKRVQSL